MHPLRTPIKIGLTENGAVTIDGTIPALDSWERVQPFYVEQIPRGPGCYGLYRDGKLIYIGESDNLQERLCNHHVAFDEVAWLRLDGAQRLLVEKALIWQFMPEDNKELKRHDYRMKIKKEVFNA